MVRNNPRRRYKEIHLASSSPEETVLMLYDGAIRFVKEAVREIDAGNITAKLQLLDKTVKIVDYLTSCLDREKGGEIAVNLRSLYSYMLVRLTEANLYNDVAKLEEIVKLLGTLREGWAGICGNPKESEVTNVAGRDSDAATSRNITVRI